MRIAFIADWRSPHAYSWIRGIAGLGHECFVLATFPTNRIPPRRPVPVEVREVPIALAGLQRVWPKKQTSAASTARKPKDAAHAVQARLLPVARVVLRHAASFDLRRATGQANRLIAAFKPDLVHALRIPYEGIFATLLEPSAPLAVSVWGNDFTLFAARSQRLGRLTRATMMQVDGLVADCHADVSRAKEWGLADSCPTAVLPGGGGIDLAWLTGAPDRAKAKLALGIDPGATVVLEPRGDRGYVRIREYCAAIQDVARHRPDVVFLFADMAGNPYVTDHLRRLGIKDRVVLLPKVSQDQMATVFAAAEVSVSPSIHDGTPNSLLESMAAGCLPIAGDIPSVREWVTHGVNGLLCDPCSPAAITREILRGLTDQELVRAAASHNRDLVHERASRNTVMAAADAYYQSLAAS